MKTSRSSGEVFGLAFLDIITCGFGALILLLILAKPEPPPVAPPSADVTSTRESADARVRVEGIVARLRAQWDTLRHAAPSRTTPAAIHEADQRLTQLRSDNEGLERVKTSLRRAAINTPAPAAVRDPEIGGIPVDSEYVIFIIDTSGSMQGIWTQVMETVDNVLDNHPTVRGFQVMNDNGDYLLNGYKRKWIPDTPGMRRNVLKVARHWTAFSNSSPVEGLQVALRTYAKQKAKVAIYIFGDDYSGNTYDQVLATLKRFNDNVVTGKRHARIHAVGFISSHSTERYATLMRAVTQSNDGAFLALPVRDTAGRTGVTSPMYRDGMLRQRR